MMMFQHAVFAISIALTPPNGLMSPDSMMVELRKGGYTILWRHAATDYTTRDVPGATERSQQRNLTAQGALDAEIIGRMLKLRGIPIGEVLASPMFRTRETAERAFGRTGVTMLLRTLDPSAEERQLMLTPPAPGTNRVLVTHHFIIERNVPGVRPGDILEGEAAVVRLNGEALGTVGIFKMPDWRRLAEATPGSGVTPGSLLTPAPPVTNVSAGPPKPPPPPSTVPLVLPAVLETPRNAIIASYLQTFNAGDAGKMRAFFEQFSVPNPSRTMEQRLESYARLRGDLGNLTITSADAAGADQVVVQVAGSTGTAGTITFTLEAATPSRLVSISVRYVR